ncbi:oligosaccharide flippase family protein [Butyrivibrio sp. MC2013]|uniref:oligosaccharide flippase family protein n=1 Tax=Butyrivibrio sp. MC2013 TaxID=1280686 RepID=UPI000412FB1B|nr:oligosaccharide flippase family protein [Butyrivibrio sp. MC2013]
MKKSIINYLYTAAYQLFLILIPLVTTPYIVRTLGAEGMGSYAYAHSVAYYFCLFVKLGIQNYGSRLVAAAGDDRKKLSQAFGELYAMQCVMMLICTGLYLIYCMTMASDSRFAFIFALFILAAGFDISWFYFGIENFRYTVIKDFIVKILSVTAIFTLVKSASDVWIYAVIQGMGILISQLVLWTSIRGYVDIIRPGLDDIMRHIRPNLILFVPVIAVSVYKTMDKIMLGAMTGERELGYYYSSENIIQIPLALIISLGTVMIPRMTKVYKGAGGDNKAERIFERSIYFAVFIASSVSIGIMTVAREFVPIFYGEGFDKCVGIYYIMLPSCVFIAFANVIRTQYLIPNNWDRVFVTSLLSGAGLNFLMNLLLIPRLQSYGAALGTLFAEALVCIYQAVAVRKVLPIGRYLIGSVKFILAGYVMFAAFYKMPFAITGRAVADLMIKIIVAGAVYMLCLGIEIMIERYALGAKNRTAE